MRSAIFLLAFWLGAGAKPACKELVAVSGLSPDAGGAVSAEIRYCGVVGDRKHLFQTRFNEAAWNDRTVSKHEFENVMNAIKLGAAEARKGGAREGAKSCSHPVRVRFIKELGKVLLEACRGTGAYEAALKMSDLAYRLSR